MAHLSADELAALAVDPDHEAPPATQEHLRTCRSCAAQADELRGLVRELRDARPTDLRAPAPTVWAGVEQDLATDGTAVPVTTTPGPVGARDGRAAVPGRRRRRAVAAVAAAVGLVVGVGGTLGALALRPAGRPALVATAVLAPLPGEAGGGTAELVRSDDALQLRVHASLGSAPTRDFHEVWLVNGDGRRMYALGVLPSSGDASYWLPEPVGAGLDGYRTVDISLEPEDGDTAHSQHSLVRGELPG